MRLVNLLLYYYKLHVIFNINIDNTINDDDDDHDDDDDDDDVASIVIILLHTFIFIIYKLYL